jgi:pimeloyl-ACP methyl ester carboxylesterase
MSRKETVHIIYISGFGSSYDGIRRFLLKFWRVYGVSTQFVSSKWSDGQSYTSKLRRINAAIDQNTDKRVVLLGESAGASLAINVYATRPNDLYRAMSLCGKNSGANTVAARVYAKNPAFKESIRLSDAVVPKLNQNERKNFTSVYPLKDFLIPVHETILPGSRKVRIWSFGHLTSILLSLSLYSFIIVREARRQR